jgi:hypothetical protein
MSMIRKMVSALVLTAMLGACAGRDPNPVGVVQQGDQSLDCTAIQAQVIANDNQIRALSKESSNTTGGNIALGVVGAILFWPALFAMDFKGAADKETAALQSRQSYLGTLAAQRGCGSPVASAKPVS